MAAIKVMLPRHTKHTDTLNVIPTHGCFTCKLALTGLSVLKKMFKHNDYMHVQLLSKNFCHNYLHTPVTLNWLPYA